LDSVCPLAIVDSSICPFVYAVAVFFVHHVGSFVVSAVLPGVVSEAVHVVVFPAADVFSSVFPGIGALW